MDRSSPHPHYQFGPFKIDAAKRVLLREGATVPLTPKCYEILLALVEGVGEVVSKDDLMKRVWPDSFVEDGNLTYNVSMLRKALGERAGEHQYIVTIPGRGYKFAGSVIEGRLEGTREAAQDQNQLSDAFARRDNEQEQSETEPTKETIPSTFREIKRNRRLTGLITPIVFIAVAVIGYVAYRAVAQRQQVAPLRALAVTPLTDSGRVQDAAVSPDGKSIVYTLYENEKSSLWLKNLSTGSEIQILAPADAGCDGLTFSTDCNYIYFSSDDLRQPMATLYQIPVFGGAVRKLIEGIDSSITLSPDGSRLAFVRNDEIRGESALMMANSDGTCQQTLAVRKRPEEFGRSPAWSPDGKTIACPVWSPPGDGHGHTYEMIEVGLRDGTEKRFSKQWWGRVAGLRWLSDSRGLVMISGESIQPCQIWRLSYPDGEVQRITNDTSDYANPSLTADSRALVVARRNYLDSICVTNNGDPNQTNPIILGANNSDGGLGLEWTADGKILYTTNRNQNWHIWIMDADGSNRRQLTFGPLLDGTPVRSGDRYVVFPSERSESGFQIWRMNIDGSDLKQLTYGKHDEEPQCSPDGEWVVYGSPDSGKSTLWKVPIDGGNPVRLTDKAVKAPAAISPDGKLIAYLFLDEQVKPQRWKIAVIPFEGGEPIRVFGTSPALDSQVAIRWTPDGRALAYCESHLLTTNIWIQPLDGSQRKQLTTFKNDPIIQFEWSRDGKRVAIIHEAITSDIVMLNGIN